MAPASAATSRAFCAAGVAAALGVLLEVLGAGCSGSDSDRVTPTPFDATSDAEGRDANPKDAAAKDGGRGDAGEPGDGAEAEADALPTSTFDGALWVNPGECNLGEIGATFRGIPAYCQPASADSYGFYQCDELANRFMRDSLEHPDLDNVETEYAASICERASDMPAYSVWGPGYAATLGHAPVAGDLVVFPGTPGHVAVIVGFESAIWVTIIQQNAGPSTTHAEWDPTSSFFGSAECWVHAESAPPAVLPDGSSCDCFTGGDTCGLAIVDHEWWNGCRAQVPDGGVDYGSLYSCEGGAYTKTADCPALCITPNIYDASGYCGH
jgi:hypothetical protein